MYKVALLNLVLSASFIISANPVKAAVYINEVLNNPQGPESGAEWVELYNPGAPQSLTNCILKLDDDSETQKIVFAEEDFIDKFKVISWTGVWLNNSGDQIKLSCGEFEDSVIYGDVPGSTVPYPGEGVTFGRNPDGSGPFAILSAVTLGSNNSSPLHTPTPELITEAIITPVIYSPTNKPTVTVKITPTFKITDKISETSAPLISKAFTPTQSVQESVTYAAVAQENFIDESDENTSSPAGKVLSSKTRRIIYIPVIISAFGLLLIAGSIAWLFIKPKKDIISEDAEKNSNKETF